jgi:7-cyano-7-deazaguanine synthase in queuosine biosynthesis
MVVPVFMRTAPSQAVPATYRTGLVLDILPDAGRATVATSFATFLGEVGSPLPLAIDFLQFSTGIFVADKKALRRLASDRWTRHFQVSVPVDDPAAWGASTPYLSEALAFLTGDQWDLSWRHEPTQNWPAVTAEPERFDAVCLFSGGLDSLVGAINLLEERPDSRILLVGHYDSSLTPGVQRRLAEALCAHYGPRLQLVQALLRPANVRPLQQYPLPSGREITTRSRSIAFLGLGLTAAAAQSSQTPLYVPENGFIAVNTPLNDARLGSCSTRTTHPYFLGKLRRGLQAIGLANPIVNPYLLATKGELLAGCRNGALLAQLAALSVSCAHPEQGRYEQTGYGNCGYCFPCLIRRAALNVVGLDDPAQYRRDVCTDASFLDGRSARGRDARAVFTAFHAAADPARAGSLAPALSGSLRGFGAKDVARVYRRGVEELQDLFLAKANAAVRGVAGLP